MGVNSEKKTIERNQFDKLSKEIESALVILFPYNSFIFLITGRFATPKRLQYVKLYNKITKFFLSIGFVMLF